MPRTSKEEAPVLLDEDAIEGRYVELGPYTIGFETFKQDIDPAFLFKGLSDDRCQCPHWGVVLKGKLVFRYADREEVYLAGDAYFGEPGHTPVVFAGTEIVEFSPTRELQETMAVLAQNMQALKQDA